MPLVSVVIPTRNSPQSFRRALDSALAQTEADLEVLVIDDGSSTDTAERVVSERADSRVRYIRFAEHRGVSAARNAGVLAATGKYVAFLDDDDERLPEKLERQVETLEQADESVCAVYTARFTIDEARDRMATTRFPRQFRPAAGNAVTMSSVLVKRQYLIGAGTFDEEFEAGADYDMWIRLAQRFDFVYLDLPLVKYYVHPGSVSSDYRKRRRASELLLKKHWALFAANRADLAREYASLGMTCHHEGDIAEATRAFWKAMRACPLRFRTYMTAARAYLSVRTLKLLLRRRSSGAHETRSGRPKRSARSG
jgi:glycosyltransferase involved in cell wall biosynthesis